MQYLVNFTIGDCERDLMVDLTKKIPSSSPVEIKAALIDLELNKYRRKAYGKHTKMTINSIHKGCLDYDRDFLPLKIPARDVCEVLGVPMPEYTYKKDVPTLFGFPIITSGKVPKSLSWLNELSGGGFR